MTIRLSAVFVGTMLTVGGLAVVIFLAAAESSLLGVLRVVGLIFTLNRVLILVAVPIVFAFSVISVISVISEFSFFIMCKVFFGLVIFGMRAWFL